MDVLNLVKFTKFILEIVRIKQTGYWLWTK